jgi:hypothetical protein
MNEENSRTEEQRAAYKELLTLCQSLTYKLKEVRLQFQTYREMVHDIFMSQIERMNEPGIDALVALESIYVKQPVLKPQYKKKGRGRL